MMKRKLILLGLSIFVIASSLLVLMPKPPVYAAGIPAGCPGGPAGPTAPNVNCSSPIQPGDLINLPKGSPDSVISIGLKIVFALAGAISVLIIIIAGLRLTTSSGNPDAINKARNTIIYAVLGLVFSIAAFSIVTFVLKQL